MDMSKLSYSDLRAIQSGDLRMMSAAGLKMLANSAKPAIAPMNVDPTDGMSTLDKFLAGTGKGMTDIARGVGQAVGLVDRADVAESRRLDKALMESGAGKVGAITGTFAAMLPTALIPGVNTMGGAAALGAGAGMLAPSTSTEETLKNTALGGVAGPVALGIGRGIGAVYQGGKALIEPFTRGGQDRIAARTMQQFATDPKAAAARLSAPEVFVPGSTPTMAQASRDPGLAQLERTLMNNPETGGALAQQYAAQRAARSSALDTIAGTDTHYNAIKEGRSVFANEDYAKAMAEGIDAGMAKVMNPQIQNLMMRPSIQQARKEAISLAKENGQSISNFGSIEGLDWLKKGLDNIISKASSPGSSIGDAKFRAMAQTKQDLVDVIEQIAPAYKTANDNFAQMSRQVNAMDAARLIKEKFQPALNGYGATGREHSEAYAKALDAARESIKKSTGMDVPLEQVMPKADLTMLEGIAKDLARKAATDDMGRAVGSNTAQNLAAQNLLRRVLGPTGLPQSWAESQGLQNLLLPYTSVAKLAGTDKRVMDRLLQAASDPKDAAALLKAATPIRKAGLLDEYLPGIMSGGLIPGMASGGLLSNAR